MSNNGTQTGRLFGVNFFSGFQRLKYKTLLWYFCNEEASRSLEISIREHVLQLQGKLKLDTEITTVEKETDTVPSLFLDSFHLHSSRKQAPNWKHGRNWLFQEAMYSFHDFCRKRCILKRFSTSMHCCILFLSSSAAIVTVFLLLQFERWLKLGFETSLLRCHGQSAGEVPQLRW